MLRLMFYCLLRGFLGAFLIWVSMLILRVFKFPILWISLRRRDLNFILFWRIMTIVSWRLWRGFFFSLLSCLFRVICDSYIFPALFLLLFIFVRFYIFFQFLDFFRLFFALIFFDPARSHIFFLIFFWLISRFTIFTFRNLIWRLCFI